MEDKVSQELSAALPACLVDTGGAAIALVL